MDKIQTQKWHLQLRFRDDDEIWTTVEKHYTKDQAESYAELYGDSIDDLTRYRVIGPVYEDVHSIDWTRFNRNVMRDSTLPYYKDYRKLSAYEWLSSYIDVHGSGFPTKEDVERWANPSDVQPTPNQYDILLRLIDIALMVEDESVFWASIEGDYCSYVVNVAGRLERGEYLTDGDWKYLINMRYLEERFEDLNLNLPDDWHIISDNELLPSKEEIFMSKDYEDNIFDQILC